MRILLKLSGEVLGGPQGMGLDADTLARFAAILGQIAQKHELAIVTGGGNIMRGKTTKGLDRAKADQIGMMATVVNCMTLEQHLIAQGTPACAMSSVNSLSRRYDIPEARELLSKHTVVLVAGGTSNPYFTTDSAAALRALELKCDLLIKATKVDGVYDADPAKHPEAKRYESLSFDEVLDKNLGVMDLTAMILCKENGLQLRVCAVDCLSDLDSILSGNGRSTLVHL
ncbi:MAG: uridine monophosphate kinase [Proteobacteria bacterium]|nr:uridine monophosphate kinase [Pseudomonadota bacterium]